MILRALRGMLLRAGRRPAAQRTGEALIYLDALTGLPRVRTSSADVAMTGSGGGGGGGGAPTTASYVVLGTDATLTSERVAMAGTGLVLSDAGAGSTLTFSVEAGLASLTTADATAGLPYVTGANTWSTATLGDLAVSGGAWTVTQARGLRETAGPTTLTMGDVADGQILKRSGATIVGAYIALAMGVSSMHEITAGGSDLGTITGNGGSVA